MLYSPAFLLAVGVGGAVGSVCRLLLGGWISRFAQTSWPNLVLPVGTMTVNLIGSFLIGVVFAWLDQSVREPGIRDAVHGFVLVGVLGGFTTFSTFSLETVHLLGLGLWGKALLNIIASVVSCVFAAFAGLSLLRWLG